MTITGLEDDYYCVHNPIPITASTDSTSPVQQLRVTFGGIYTAIYYNLERNVNTNVFYMDISRWVRQLMANFEEIYTYTTTPTTYPQPYTKSIEITFEAIGTGDTATITKKYNHCALDSYNLQDDDTEFCCVKIWAGYPFSSPFDGWDTRVLVIPDCEGNVCSTIPFVCEKYDMDCSYCKGVYVKWLNDKGYYSYWLFPDIHTANREGEEIDRKPRSPFSPFHSSNEDTLGFDATEIITVRDIVPREYWDTLKTLVQSPEVYILRPSWQQGTDDTAVPDDWIKVIQDKPEFEREYKFNSAEFEIDLELPKIYTAKRI